MLFDNTWLPSAFQPARPALPCYGNGALSSAFLEMPPPALYVHIPFCHSECTYCDFYRVSYRDEVAGAFLHALRSELSGLPRDPPPPTVYVGGGTPSALREGQLQDLLEALQPFRARGQELTFEVNPKSATPAKVELLAQAGVTRVSFGAQTFNADALRMLGRRHGPEDIERVYWLLRERIASISFDLIFALPGQTIEDWDLDLSSALRLSPDHLSVYSLIHEPGTPLTREIEKGERKAVGEELEREMFLLAADRLTSAGYEHYEVSSHGRPGHRSRHNEAYWNQDDYVGAGPAACSTLGCLRYVNVRDLEAYVRGVEATGAPPREEEHLTALDRLNEHLLLRLRTRDGLSLAGFRRRSGMLLEEYSRGGLKRMLESGFLDVAGDTVRLTREGLCVADRVIAELLRMA